MNQKGRSSIFLALLLILMINTGMGFQCRSLSALDVKCNPWIKKTLLRKFHKSRQSMIGKMGATGGISNGDTTGLLSGALKDPLIVYGPSGVGKGTIIEKFMKERGGSEQFGFSVSHTTRSPRPNEINGVHYHFVTKDDMMRDIASGLFIEHAAVHGNFYGTSWKSLADVQATGKKCLLDIDVQGVKNLKAINRDDFRPKYIFIAPPSLALLRERLSRRGTESPENLERRFKSAEAEVEFGTKNGNFDALIVNEDLEQAVQEFISVVKKLYG